MQQTPRNRLQITIAYDITPTAGGSKIDRTGAITTRGIARALHWIVVALIRRENSRTMRCLGTYLDQSTGAGHQEEP